MTSEGHDIHQTVLCIDCQYIVASGGFLGDYIYSDVLTKSVIRISSNTTNSTDLVANKLYFLSVRSIYNLHFSTGTRSSTSLTSTTAMFRVKLCVSPASERRSLLGQGHSGNKCTGSLTLCEQDEKGVEQQEMNFRPRLTFLL